MIISDNINLLITLGMEWKDFTNGYYEILPFYGNFKTLKLM